MSQADLVTDTTADQSQQAFLQSLALLIEVPAIKPLPSARGSRTRHQRMPITGRTPRRSRRRLRREVRLAGSALLALVPILSACTLGWSNRPDRIVACAISDPLQSEVATDHDGLSDHSDPALPHRLGRAIASSGVVVLSTEPPAAASGTSVDPPVIFPGYILPDDTREDLLHEGS